MKRILMQSDDYGITDAVSDGILKSIKDGFIRNTGLFVNMESSEKSVHKIKDIDVCLGIDINYVAGKPVTNSSDVPNLVNEKGFFRSSRDILKNNTLIKRDGFAAVFAEDPFPYEEILLEIENQVKKFIDLVGRNPEYLHPHSLCTPNTLKPMREVATKYGIPFSLDILESDAYIYFKDSGLANKNKSFETQLSLDKRNQLLNEDLPSIKDGDTCIYISHCGYVDYDLFAASSLTLERVVDLEIATDKEILDLIKNNSIELITYRDLI